MYVTDHHDMTIAFEVVKNTVGKEEIACNEYFPLFPQVFKGLVRQKCKHIGLFGKGLNQNLQILLEFVLEKLKNNL